MHSEMQQKEKERYIYRKVQSCDTLDYSVNTETCQQDTDLRKTYNGVNTKIRSIYSKKQLLCSTYKLFLVSVIFRCSPILSLTSSLKACFLIPSSRINFSSGLWMIPRSSLNVSPASSSFPWTTGNFLSCFRKLFLLLFSLSRTPSSFQSSLLPNISFLFRWSAKAWIPSLPSKTFWRLYFDLRCLADFWDPKGGTPPILSCDWDTSR